MRNSATILGIIAGIIGMIVGFFSYGYTEFIDWFGEVDGTLEQVENVGRVQAVSLLAPILAIAGGGMARYRPMVGGGLMLISAAGMYWAFSFNVFTMFPIAMAALAGIFAVSAGATRTR